MVCFDIGNVLVKLGRSTKEIFDIEDEKELHFLLKSFSLGNINRLDFLKKLKSMIKNKNLALDEIEFIFINKRIEKINDGVLELVKELENKKINLSIISNTNDLHWSFLEKNLPINSFNEIILSHVYKIEKPNKKIYQILENKTGFKNKEIIFFDDINENILTASNLGWNANLVPIDKPVEFMRKILHENNII